MLEEQHTEFKAHIGMPEVGTKLCNWQMIQMRNGPTGLNVKIEKETESNEGGAVCRDRKARLED